MEKTNGQVSGDGSAPVIKRKGAVTFLFIVFYLVSACVLAYGAYQYGFYQGKSQGTGHSEQPGEIIVTSQDAGTGEPLVTVTPMITARLNPTVKPTVTLAQTQTGVPNYTYRLPGGWQIVQTIDATFEVGFDSGKYQPNIENSGEIRIVSLSDSSMVFDIKRLDFSGTDKRSFILNTVGISSAGLGQAKEKGFSVDGRECLFIEGIGIGGFGPILGMCQAGSGKAFLIDARTADYLPTVLSLKNLR